MAELMDGSRETDLVQTKERVAVESEVKLRFFMVALVFTIISFAIQNSLEDAPLWLRGIEALSWILLSGAGIFGIKDIGGFSLAHAKVGNLTRNGRAFMWGCFLSGLYGLMLVKMLAHIGV